MLQPRSKVSGPRSWLIVATALAAACGKSHPARERAAPASDEHKVQPTFGLAALRSNLKTTIFHDCDRTPAVEPPAEIFSKTKYRRGHDELVAYETLVQAGARRPAIVWIAGGFDWGIGDSAWVPAPRSNDQSAAAFREAGLVLMLPALRGCNENPGRSECFLGEVDDVIAAGEHLATRPDVDPQRIYLGGHSTGATMALLAAASTDRFRAVFAFGPVADPRGYGASGCLLADQPEREYEARSPLRWIHEVVTPTYILEGEDGNADQFPVLAARATAAVTFLVIPNSTHFSALRPASEAVARAILADTGPTPSFSFDVKAIAAAVER